MWIVYFVLFNDIVILDNMSMVIIVFCMLLIIFNKFCFVIGIFEVLINCVL